MAGNEYTATTGTPFLLWALDVFNAEEMWKPTVVYMIVKFLC